MQDGQVEIHDNVECCVVHPNGQLQTINECWCKIYHTFGQNIEPQDVEVTTFDHFGVSYHCTYLSKGTINGQQLPLNIALQRRLMKQIYGPGIFFQRGRPTTQDQSRKILLFQQ